MLRGHSSPILPHGGIATLGAMVWAWVGTEKRGAARSKSTDSWIRFFAEIIYCSCGNSWCRLFNTLKELHLPRIASGESGYLSIPGSCLKKHVRLRRVYVPWQGLVSSYARMILKLGTSGSLPQMPELREL